MSKKELLEFYLNAERNIMFQTAADYHMDRGRPGMEREFLEAQKRADLLVDMLEHMGQA